MLLVPGGSTAEPTERAFAEVVGVTVSGQPGAYNFSVTVRSPDAGCERYASFWEVLHEDGTFAYRRVLRHSHVDEQPFTRAGGPIPVQADERIAVRAHLHPDGYGGAVFTGTVADGLVESEAPDFAVDVAAPEPTDCAF